MKEWEAGRPGGCAGDTLRLAQREQTGDRISELTSDGHISVLSPGSVRETTPAIYDSRQCVCCVCVLNANEAPIAQGTKQECESRWRIERGKQQLVKRRLNFVIAMKLIWFHFLVTFAHKHVNEEVVVYG